MKPVAILVTALVCVVLVPSSPSRADEVHLAVGGGVVGNEADVDGGSEIEGDGVYGTFQAAWGSGLLLRASLSASEDDEDDGAEDELRRLDASIGYIWRLDRGFRPFVHGGLAFVGVEETDELTGLEVIDDRSQVLTLGAGFSAGTEHHAFYLDLNFDNGHEVDANFALGDVEFDLREVHLGYLYRF